MSNKAVKLERTIVIKPEIDPLNPREEHDNVGIMACWHSQYRLGDVEQTDHKGCYIDRTDGPYEFAKALETALTEIMWKRRPALKKLGYTADDEYIPCPRGCKGEEENPFWVGEGPGDYAKSLETYGEYEHLVSPANRLIYMPLYLYDHGGITMSTGSFSCPWDSGQVGWIFCTGATAIKEWGKTRLTKKVVEAARKYLEAEVETYDQYLTGQVYKFAVYEHEAGCDPEDGELIDSCGGFYSYDCGSDWEEMEMTYHWPEGWESYRIVVDGNEEQEWREAA